MIISVDRLDNIRIERSKPELGPIKEIYIDIDGLIDSKDADDSDPDLHNPLDEDFTRDVHLIKIALCLLIIGILCLFAVLWADQLSLITSILMLFMSGLWFYRVHFREPDEALTALVLFRMDSVTSCTALVMSTQVFFQCLEEFALNG